MGERREREREQRTLIVRPADRPKETYLRREGRLLVPRIYFTAEAFVIILKLLHSVLNNTLLLHHSLTLF